MNNWIKWSRDWRGSFDKNPEKSARLSAVYQYLAETATWNDFGTTKAGQVRTSIPKITKGVALFSEGETKALVNSLCRSGHITSELTSESDFFGRLITISDWQSKFGDISTYEPIYAGDTPVIRRSLPLESLDNIDSRAGDTPVIRRSNTKELKKERNKEIKKTTSLSLAVAEDLSWIDIATEWNMRLPNHSQVRIPILRKNDKRKSDIRKAIEKHTSEIIIEAIDKIYSSEFLCGKNDRQWKPDLDWIIKTENIQKVLEGKYEDKNKPIPKDRYLV